jgi:hypothetical protein
MKDQLSVCDAFLDQGFAGGGGARLRVELLHRKRPRHA